MGMKFQIDANDRWDLKIPEERKQAAQKCLNNANGFIAFAASAFSASEIKMKYPFLPEVKDIDKRIPFRTHIIVNIPLSIELFLKAMLLSKNPGKPWTTEQVKSLKIHRLDKLYYKLDGKHQNGIFNLFQPVPTARSRDEFKLNLKEVSRAFEDLRYVHELKGVGVTSLFIYSFSSAVANYVNDTLGEQDES